jgi:hypothetical protein
LSDKKPKLSELGSFSVWESTWKLRGKGKEKLEFFYVIYSKFLASIMLNMMDCDFSMQWAWIRVMYIMEFRVLMH